MPSSTFLYLLFFIFINFLQLSTQETYNNGGKYNFSKAALFKNPRVLIVDIAIGTPPQFQKMVLDTGSQLSWIPCPRLFNPSLSSTFYVLPCNDPSCKPKIPDFTLPTTCDKNRCHYSFFYADGTSAEGNLVTDKFTLSNSQTTPPLILGCDEKPTGESMGILGMNLGRLSFSSQAKVNKFSYCIPQRQGGSEVMPTGTFYLGQNPSSHVSQYINLLTFPHSEQMPNLDPLAYTVNLIGISIGGKQLNIPPSIFQPDRGGSGQTIIDSATEYTLLVEEAYNKVRDEIVSRVGLKLKNGNANSRGLDMCFDGNSTEIGQLIGDMVLIFENGVEIFIDKEKVLDDVGGGLNCFGIIKQLPDSGTNIIGSFHQQNLWVEFDLANKKVGFGKANCGKSG